MQLSTSFKQSINEASKLIKGYNIFGLAKSPIVTQKIEKDEIKFSSFVEDLIKSKGYDKSEVLENSQDFISILSHAELIALHTQHGAAILSPENFARRSEYGEECCLNLLSQNGEVVDLNNDGVGEVGAVASAPINAVFPPLNAPEEVKEAWADMIKGMSADGRKTLGFMLLCQGDEMFSPRDCQGHISDYGYNHSKAVANYLSSINDYSEYIKRIVASRSKGNGVTEAKESLKKINIKLKEMMKRECDA